MYTSCWLLYSEQIYSPTIAIILQWGLMESIPTFPPLPSSATSSICYNSKQILSTLLSSHGNLLPALKAQGSSHPLPGESKFLLAPSLQPRLPHLLRVLSVCAPASLILGGNLHLCRAEVPSWLPQLSILQVLPMFHFCLKLSLPKGHGTCLPIKAQHFLRNKPRGPRSWVIWVSYWITALKSILPQHSAFAVHLSVPCNSIMFLSLTTEYSSMVHTAVYPCAMNLPNCKIWRKHPHKMPSVQAPTTSLGFPGATLPSVKLTTYLESLHNHTQVQ